MGWGAVRHAPCPARRQSHAGGKVTPDFAETEVGGPASGRWPARMTPSPANVLIHLVFSTRDRAPCLEAAWRPVLHGYLAGTARGLGCDCARVGGWADHVHVAIRLPRALSIGTLVEELKASSARWLSRGRPGLAGFAWQRGYAAFSVAPAEFASLLAYIDEQEELHRTRTFQDEYRDFLGRYALAYDEHSVWD